jgi:drug/metabolite transporter (DMT)-like permease
MAQARTDDSATAGVQDNPVLGIVYMLLGFVAISLMDAVGKWLVGSVPVPQMLAIRAAIILVVLVAWQMWRQDFRSLMTRRPVAHGLRALAAFLAPLFFFASLRELPLADVTVVAFGSPLFMTAFSVVLLKERVGVHRWGAVLLGFVGVVVVIQPTGAGFQPIALLTVLASLSYALMMIATRYMRGTETTMALIFYANLGVGLMALCFLPFVWVDVAWDDALLLLAMAALALCGQVWITKAFMIAPVGTLAPFEYSALVWATLFGYWVWHDIPSVNVWLGAALIVGAGLYTVHRETRRAKR